MKRIAALSACLVFFACRTATFAQAATAPRLVYATVQKVPSADPDEPAADEARFILVWKSSMPPLTFFWRPKSGGWQTTGVKLVHRISKTKRIVAGTDWYNTVDVGLDKIKRGDTLELIPMRGGRDVMPAALAKSPANAIYFKTEKGPWQNLRITTFKRLP